jgi:hypothetical protein
MKRFFLMMVLAALVATPLLAADAAGSMACCKNAGVERTVTNLDNGVRMTMTAKDPKAVAMIQEMSASCSKDKPCCKDCPMAAEGVTRTVEKTGAGVVITATATNPDLVKKLQAHAATMAAGGDMKGCCKGKGDAKASGAAGVCPHAKGDAKQS